MAAKTSPITPAVLRWALAEDGRSRDEVATALKVARPQLEAWASGDELPTVGQVTTLANTLHRVRAFFFLPEPPARGSMPDGFRHPPGAGVESVSASVLLEARRAKRVQQAVASTLADDDTPELPAATLRDGPGEAAARVRAWLEVPRVRWQDEYEALRSWRALLESAGILVVQLALGEDAPRGFASWDERAPMIVMNQTKTTPQMRLFTIGHELGHLALRQATACLEPTGRALSIDTGTERWCERFSAALMMPEADVRSLMAREDVAEGEADISAVRTLMNTFSVSARAAAIRLNDLGYAREGLYASVLALFRPRGRTSTSTPRSPARHRLRVRQYGANTVANVLTALPPNDALSVLRMTVEDVRKLADEVPGVPAF